MVSLTVFLVAFFLTIIFVPIVRKIAYRIEALDWPGGRKVHSEATPLLGGVAIYASVLVTLLIFAPHREIKLLQPALISSFFIVVLGIIEDLKGLRAEVRFFVQSLIAVFLVTSGVRISFLPAVWWADICEVILTIIWIVGLINAFNYLDGLDGLASGSAVINLFFFSVILYTASQYYLSLLAVALIAGCLGFLPYNFLKSNKIFLGESGSTLLGFFLAYLGLEGQWATDGILRLFIPILILGVPIFDMVFTTILRFKEGKVASVIEWFRYSGKDHFHHYLVDVGLNPTNAVIFIYFVNISLGLSAVMVSNDTFLEGIITLYQAAIIFVLVAILMVVGKRHRSGWTK
ncbi:MAG: undecaprenyl/decaprenyl-phosphate alpha-N-acetylglucosaminyl 1-phosphate transferase [Candidatus Omnitrophica bacterium]|nr:undecaprenyl/decaprenyl-phosphate alpha-N-acetylglucosaminyl 1-phosphate transferase [Candidatus Omnitrophota bacterium]